MITVEKAKKLRAIIERAVAALELDNEAALECVELFPAWENGKAYTVETRVQYGGKLYRCVQAHTSQSDWTPPVAASLWSGVTVDPTTGYDEWKQPTGAHDAYKKGDRVQVEITAKAGRYAVAIGFALPLVLFVSTMLALHYNGATDEIAALSAIGVIGVYYIIIYLIRKYINRHFEVRLAD